MGRPASMLLLSWLGLTGLYLACVGTLSADEAVAGGVCGVLGTLWVHRLHRSGEADLTIPLRAATPVLSALLRLPARTARIGLRLLRAAAFGDLAGGIRPATAAEVKGCPFRDDAAAAGRRAVAVLATSLAPDAYVLRLDRTRGHILVHALSGPAR